MKPIASSTLNILRQEICKYAKYLHQAFKPTGYLNLSDVKCPTNFSLVILKKGSFAQDAYFAVEYVKKMPVDLFLIFFILLKQLKVSVN